MSELYKESLTFEKVWEMFQVMSRETREEMKESDRKFQVMSQKTDKQIKELSRQMGGLHNSFGELAEHMVAPGIVERFNKLGYHFDAVSPKGQRILDKHGKVKTEIDILLENGDYIIAVEVKSKPVEKDIEHHISRLKILREHRDKHRDMRKIRGAIAGAVFPAKLKEAALAAGFYVLEQSGDTMKMDIPKDFVPQEW